MNERIQKLVEQAKQYARERMSHPMNPSLYSADTFQRKFAELIVRECIKELENDTRCRIAGADKIVAKHFGVEESKGWVCPKCNADRTKEACPLGHMAAIEGKCPMVLEAQ